MSAKTCEGIGLRANGEHWYDRGVKGQAASKLGLEGLASKLGLEEPVLGTGSYPRRR